MGLVAPIETVVEQGESVESGKESGSGSGSEEGKESESGSGSEDGQ